MQQEKFVNCPIGARVSTPLLRQMNDCVNGFRGLPEGVDRYDLLRLVKKVGRKCGFTTASIMHLEYLINHTRDMDWQDGGQPIVYKTVLKTALELGVSERQINNRERLLHSLGALTWNDLGNHRRTGQRNDRGQIIFAYGINLAPLLSLYDKLLDIEAEQLAFEEAWLLLRRKLSWLLRSVTSKLDEALEGETPTDAIIPLKNKIAAIGRIRSSDSLESLEAHIATLEDVMIEVDHLITEDQKLCITANGGKKLLPGQKKTSDPLYYTNKDNTSKEESNQRISKRTDTGVSDVEEGSDFASAQNQKDGSPGEPVRRAGRVQPLKGVIGRMVSDETRGYDVAKTGIEHVSLGNALAAATDDFKTYIPDVETANWADLVEAASWRCHDIGINRSAWIEACAVMGRNGAAIAVLVLDRNQHHPDHPVKSPGGALRGMIVKAEEGDLHLHRSLFGILQRGEGHGV